MEVTELGIDTLVSQRVACRLDDGIAIVTGIVGRVSTGHHDARQALTVKERAAADGCDRVADGNTRQPTAAIKRISVDDGNRVRNRHARQTLATGECIGADGDDRIGNCHLSQLLASIESIAADGSDRVGHAVVADSRGDGHIAGTGAVTTRDTGFVVSDSVSDAV